MTTEKEYNLDLTNKTIRILKRDEILQEDDVLRLIVETCYDNGFDLTYKPKDYNPLSWHKVSYEMPAWIGEVISSNKYSTWFEFARIIKED